MGRAKIVMIPLDKTVHAVEHSLSPAKNTTWEPIFCSPELFLIYNLVSSHAYAQSVCSNRTAASGALLPEERRGKWPVSGLRKSRLKDSHGSESGK